MSINVLLTRRRARPVVPSSVSLLRTAVGHGAAAEPLAGAIFRDTLSPSCCDAVC